MIKTLCCIVAVGLASSHVSADTISPEDRAAIEVIKDEFQKECSVLQASVGTNRAETEDRSQLSLSDQSIYQLPITPDGKMATVLIPEFNCSDVGYAWCGTGGCGFFIFVDGIPFRNWVSHQPQSITIPTYTDQRTILIYPKHGGDCYAANGAFLAGSDPCYSLVFWQETLKTFISPDGSIVEWYPDMP
ncbi:hypothetical protein B9057_05995 [Aestuarium zhoushanense]|nr:hypothetical protein B9057_05995 [Aestuarium zhoushanense]